VTNLFSKSITVVVRATAAPKEMSAPLRLLIFLYISEAVSENTAEDAKFITKPYHPVVLKVNNSINAARNEIITAEIGPKTKEAIAITASFTSSERNPATGGIMLHINAVTKASAAKTAMPMYFFKSYFTFVFIKFPFLGKEKNLRKTETKSRQEFS
jgi:hypothetical protein